MAERRGQGKVALLVLDGLALDQWAVMKMAMPGFKQPVRVDDGAVFAWLPTLTSVSRQAIFAGQPPYTFASSITHTSSEEKVWRKFWDDHGVRTTQVRYLKGLEPEKSDCLGDVLRDDGVRAVGAVIGLVDNLIHEWPMERSHLFPVLADWAKAGHLTSLIEQLLSSGYEVFLTADHGNMEAVGRGKGLGASQLADIRGQRAQVYPNEELRGQGLQKALHGVSWPGSGLPENFLAVLATEGHAFAKEEERLVCHGGPSLQEVVVPFVHFRRGA
jgi:hypothetical protein